ncbi:Bug family tripartite tricarboxylate transporter substrate binding protein [Ottowia thiooxydans]|uniref:Bug family tripartite tricarboxylate transporter substrate binding protein n=1 Tax=Ottowia thiooxydans TaxID=219182 RepID=UPI0004163C9E|nr:tripartite tricarboxylate transporter substrate binding protein [Ottowia thiooxydans]
MSISFRAAFAACFVVMAPLMGVASAQTWPDKPLRLAVPFAAGGTTDLLGRLVAEGIAPELGQPVVVVNRAGAGGSLGAAEVARAAPDGYSLLLGTPGTQAINAYVYKSIGYDPRKDFAPVAYVVQVPNVLLTNPQSGFKTMADVVRAAKANPGKLNWGSPGVGSSGHLMLEMLKQRAQVDITHVPYKGASQANNDLLGGQIQLSGDNLPTALPFINSGKLVAFAVTSKDAVPTAPGVAPVSATLPGFELTSWFVLMAPAGTPSPVVNRLNAAVENWLAKPETRKRLSELSALPVGGSPDSLGRHLESEQRKYRDLTTAAKIEPQ